MVVFVLPVLGPWPSSVVDVVSVSSRSRESSETWVSKSDALSFLHGRCLVHGVPVDLGHLLQVYPVCTVGAGSMNPGSLGSGRGSRSACIMAIRSLISDVCVVAGGSRRVWVTWPGFLACLHGGFWISVSWWWWSQWGSGLLAQVLCPPALWLPVLSITWVLVWCVLDQLAQTPGPPEGIGLPQRKDRVANIGPGPHGGYYSPLSHAGGICTILKKEDRANWTSAQSMMPVCIWANGDSEVIFSANSH